LSHCAPKATLKPLYIFSSCLKQLLLWVMSSSRKCTGRLFQTLGPSAAKLLSSKCVVCAWNSVRSVGGRSESTSWTCRNQVYVVSQVRRCLAGQRRVNKTCQLEVDPSLDRKPVQLTKNWRDVVRSSSSGEKPSGGILDGLNFADKAVRQAVQQ